MTEQETDHTSQEKNGVNWRKFQCPLCEDYRTPIEDQLGAHLVNEHADEVVVDD